MSATVSAGINSDHHSRGCAVMGVTGWENRTVRAGRSISAFIPLSESAVYYSMGEGEREGVGPRPVGEEGMKRASF